MTLLHTGPTRRLKVSSERLGNEGKAHCPRALLPGRGSNRGPPGMEVRGLNRSATTDHSVLISVYDGFNILITNYIQRYLINWSIIASSLSPEANCFILQHSYKDIRGALYTIVYIYYYNYHT